MIFKKIEYKDLQKLNIYLDFSFDDEESLNIYNIYRSFFTEYIINKLNLLFYDNEFNKLGISFLVEDFYKNYSKKYLKNIFIRNNIYISKLTNNEKEFLLLNKDSKLNEDISNFIERTYDKVINIYDEKAYCFYGYQIKKYCVKADNIVLGLYNNNYDLNDKINKLIKEIENKYNKVKVLVYNEEIRRVDYLNRR